MASKAKTEKPKTNVIAMAIIIALVALGLIGWSAWGASAKGASVGLVAVVHDGEGGELELPLDTDTRQTITTSLGSNTVVVDSDGVRVEEADCANHDCAKQGSIDTPGQQIVCLPHKLWIEVVAKGDATVSSEGSHGDASGIDVESR